MVDSRSLLLGVFRASKHEQETLGVIGSNRRSQQYTPQPLTLASAAVFLHWLHFHADWSKLTLPGSYASRPSVTTSIPRIIAIWKSQRRPGAAEAVAGAAGAGRASERVVVESDCEFRCTYVCAVRHKLPEWGERRSPPAAAPIALHMHRT